jgi:uncharacterized repeat protein (TIGR03803 family)
MFDCSSLPVRSLPRVHSLSEQIRTFDILHVHHERGAEIYVVLSDGRPLRAAISLEVLHTFTGGIDGASPSSGLVQARDGHFYGTTSAGGAAGFGTVFRITSDRTFETVHAFTPPEGTASSFGLVADADGNLYGTGRGGGRADGGFTLGKETFGNNGSGLGSVFQVNPSGALTVRHRFSGGRDGANPAFRLIQGRDGNFYGTTNGQIGSSSVFKMSPAGDITVLHTFPYYSEGSPDWLIEAADGNFYGTTMTGGTPVPLGALNTTPTSLGTVFKITPAGSFTVLNNFSTNGARNGCCPTGLTQGMDGNLYGIGSAGGTFEFGAIFKLTLDGRLTMLHAFTGPDGVFPGGSLVEATDGNFYGTTLGGGPSGGGTIFRITPTGSLTTMFSFGSSTVGPLTPLIQGMDGNLYGTRGGDGRGQPGFVFRISIRE